MFPLKIRLKYDHVKYKSWLWLCATSAMKYNSTVILGAKYIRERNVLTYFNIRQNKEFIARKSYCISCWYKQSVKTVEQWTLDLRKILGVTKIFLKSKLFLISNTRKPLKKKWKENKMGINKWNWENVDFMVFQF